MSIAVERANKPPVVETASVLTLPAIPLNIRPPVDPDGDPLTITVAEVPARGAIKDGDRVVAVGDELSPEALAGLVLEPGLEGASGSFAFKVSDPGGASVTSALRVEVPGLAGPGGAIATTTETAPPAETSAEVATEPEAERAERARPRSRPRW